MQATEIRAIDVHAHYGNYDRGRRSQLDQFMTADAATVVERAKSANTVWSIVSPLRALLPRLQADAVAGNEEAMRLVAGTDGLLQWVVVNPLQPQTLRHGFPSLFCTDDAGAHRPRRDLRSRKAADPPRQRRGTVGAFK